MRIRVNKEMNEVFIDQEQYMDQILSRFNMSECKSMSTPLKCGVELKKDDKCDSNLPYQQLIGCLMYLANLTRPDICYSLSYLSLFNQCFNESHWKQAKRVLRYLQNTKSYSLKFRKGDLDLQGFVDADWAEDSLDRKSYTGFCFVLSGSTISWESRKQRTVASSSTEAEYIYLYDSLSIFF